MCAKKIGVLTLVTVMSMSILLPLVTNVMAAEVITASTTEVVSGVNTQEVSKLKENVKTLQERVAMLQADVNSKIKDKERKQNTYNELKYLLTKGSSYFMNMDLRTPTNLDAEQINQMLEGTGLVGLGDDFVRAEKEYGINALVYMALSGHESTWGNSPLAKSKNNIISYAAYDNNVEAARNFTTKGECLIEGAKLLNKDYLNPQGEHFGGGYTLLDVNKKYASDKEWSRGIALSVMDLIRKLK